MALKLENEFVVAAPIELTWRTLLDLERVARCLPGATIQPSDEEDVFRGAMRVKLGPVTMDYKGTARLEEVDEGGRTAVFAVQGKETRGQGSASASIRNRLVEEDGSTRVRVETELSVTGRPAQFGRGIMQDVAASMLADFAKCLSGMVAAEGGADRAGASAPAVAQQPEALALGGAVGRVLFRRVAGFFARLFGRRPPAA